MAQDGTNRFTRRALAAGSLIAITAAAVKLGVSTESSAHKTAPRRPRAPTKPSKAHPAVVYKSGPYDPTLTPPSGPVGTPVRIAGPIPTLGEAGQPVELSHLPVWWNLNPDYPSQAVRFPASAGSGALIKLLDIALSADQTTYEASFTAPAVDAGLYPVVVLQKTPDGSVANLGTSTFRLTG